MTAVFRSLPVGRKATVKIPLDCIDAGGSMDFERISTPFLIYTEGTFSASFANIRWQPGAANDPDAWSCGNLK
jgi:beta-glucosidase